MFYFFCWSNDNNNKVFEVRYFKSLFLRELILNIFCGPENVGTEELARGGICN